MTNIKYLILAGCLSLPGCGSDEINLEPVTSDIGLEVAEIHPKTDAIPQLSLTMETTEHFPCANYFIRTHTRQQGEILIIRLLDIGIHSICFTAFGSPVPGYRSAPPYHRSYYRKAPKWTAIR